MRFLVRLRASNPVELIQSTWLEAGATAPIIHGVEKEHACRRRSFRNPFPCDRASVRFGALGRVGRDPACLWWLPTQARARLEFPGFPLLSFGGNGYAHHHDHRTSSWIQRPSSPFVHCYFDDLLRLRWPHRVFDPAHVPDRGRSKGQNDGKAAPHRVPDPVIVGFLSSLPELHMDWRWRGRLRPPSIHDVMRSGRSGEIRTHDPCLPKTVLYQAELHSDRGVRPSVSAPAMQGVSRAGADSPAWRSRGGWCQSRGASGSGAPAGSRRCPPRSRG